MSTAPTASDESALQPQNDLLAAVDVHGRSLARSVCSISAHASNDAAFHTRQATSTTLIILSGLDRTGWQEEPLRGTKFGQKMRGGRPYLDLFAQILPVYRFPPQSLRGKTWYIDDPLTTSETTRYVLKVQAMDEIRGGNRRGHFYVMTLSDKL